MRKKVFVENLVMSRKNFGMCGANTYLTNWVSIVRHNRVASSILLSIVIIKHITPLSIIKLDTLTSITEINLFNTPTSTIESANSVY